MRCINLAVIGTAAAALALGIAAPVATASPHSATHRSRHHKKKASPLTFRVSFDLNHGRFFMTATNPPSPSLSESDEKIHVETVWVGLKLGRHSAPDFQALESEPDVLSGSWETFGGNLDCSGRLKASDSAGLFAHLSDRRPYLAIQAVGKDFRVANSHGSTHYCSGLDGSKAFLPFTDRFMPDAMEVAQRVSLARLRGLARGREITFKVTDHDGILTFPDDCSVGSISCTEHLHWEGTIKVIRTS